MILFPNAKINIGLRVLRRRPDAYHDIESLFVPLPWCDILEIVPAAGGEGSFNIVGEDILKLDNEVDNLVVKALRALESYLGRQLPPLDIYLNKRIPTGAGLGGGSADASFALRGVNELLGLGLDNEQLAAVAAKVGADCPFFIYNRPMLVEGIGDVMTPVEAPGLDDLWVLAAKIPGTEVSTRQAYVGVTPAELPEGVDMAAALQRDPVEWVGKGLTNDFEPSVFAAQPGVAALKDWFNADGGRCAYCSMSGSGSTVYGVYHSHEDACIYEEKLRHAYPGADIFVGRLSSRPVG